MPAHRHSARRQCQLSEKRILEYVLLYVSQWNPHSLESGLGFRSPLGVWGSRCRSPLLAWRLTASARSPRRVKNAGDGPAFVPTVPRPDEQEFRSVSRWTDGGSSSWSTPSWQCWCCSRPPRCRCSNPAAPPALASGCSRPDDVAGRRPRATSRCLTMGLVRPDWDSRSGPAWRDDRTHVRRTQSSNAAWSAQWWLACSWKTTGRSG